MAFSPYIIMCELGSVLVTGFSWTHRRHGGQDPETQSSSAQTYSEKVHVQVTCYWCSCLLLVFCCDQRDEWNFTSKHFAGTLFQRDLRRLKDALRGPWDELLMGRPAVNLMVTGQSDHFAGCALYDYEL